MWPSPAQPATSSTYRTSSLSSTQDTTCCHTMSCNILATPVNVQHETQQHPCNACDNSPRMWPLLPLDHTPAYHHHPKSATTPQAYPQRLTTRVTYHCPKCQLTEDDGCRRLRIIHQRVIAIPNMPQAPKQYPLRPITGVTCHFTRSNNSLRMMAAVASGSYTSVSSPSHASINPFVVATTSTVSFSSHFSNRSVRHSEVRLGAL